MVWELGGLRASGFEGLMVWGLVGLRAWGLKSLRALGFEGLRVWVLKGLRGWELEGLKARGLKGLRACGLKGLRAWGLNGLWVLGLKVLWNNASNIGVALATPLTHSLFICQYCTVINDGPEPEGFWMARNWLFKKAYQLITVTGIVFLELDS